jgi:hypothetical protein
MRGLMRLVHGFAGKKLAIAETAKVIQEKIMNITQVVPLLSPRMMLKSSALSSASETVSPELLASTRSKPEKWLNSDQASGGWLST